MSTLVNINNSANFPGGLARLVQQYPDTYERNRMVQQSIHSASDWDPGRRVPIDGGHYNQAQVFDRDRTARTTATWLNEVVDSRLHQYYVPSASNREQIMYGDTADSIQLYRSASSRRPLW